MNHSCYEVIKEKVNNMHLFASYKCWKII